MKVYIVCIMCKRPSSNYLKTDMANNTQEINLSHFLTFCFLYFKHISQSQYLVILLLNYNFFLY